MRGEAEFYLVIIIPVITGTGPVFAAGALLFFFGIMLLMFAWSLRSATAAYAEEPAAPRDPQPQGQRPRGQPQGQPAPRSGVEFGGVVFIGPIPITFGSGPKMGRLMLVAAIVMAVLMIAFFLGLFL